MILRFARDAVMYGGSAVMVRAVGLLVLPVYTRFVSPADYGTVDLLLIFGSFAMIIVSLELHQGAARFLPEAEAKRRTELVSASIAYAVPAYTLFAVMLAVLADPVADLLLGRPDARDLVRVSAMAMAVMGVFQLLHSELRSMLQPARYAAANLGFVVASGTTGVIAVALLGTGASGILFGLGVGSVVGIVLVVRLGRGMYHFRWDSRSLKEMLGFSLPLVPSGVAVAIMASVDRLIVNSTLGLGDVGVYGAGLRIASVVAVVMLAFRASLTPLVYASHLDAQTPRDIDWLFRGLVVVAGVFSVVIAVFASEIVALVVGPAYAEARTVVPLLTTASVIGGMYIFAPGLAIAQRTSMIALVSITAAAVTTAAGLALIPTLGLVGGTVSALIGAVALFLGYVILGDRYYSIPFSWPKAAFVLAVVVLVDLAAVTIDVDPLEAILPRAALAIAAIAAIMIFGPIPPKDVRRILTRLREQSY